MQTCDEILDMISLRVDGELTKEAQATLAEHLDTCPACRALAEDLARLHTEMPALNETPPAFLMENVMARIKGARAVTIPFPGKKQAPQWRAWGGVAAALVLVATGIFALGGGMGGNAPGSVAPMSVAAGEEKARGEAAPMAPAASPPAPLPSAAPSVRPNLGAVGVPFAVEPKAADSELPRGTEGPEESGSPAASAQPVMHLTTLGAAMKLYEVEFAAEYPDLEPVVEEDFVGYLLPLGDLAYEATAEDGTAYLFCLYGTDGVNVEYLVSTADGTVSTPEQ